MTPETPEVATTEQRLAAIRKEIDAMCVYIDAAAFGDHIEWRNGPLDATMKRIASILHRRSPVVASALNQPEPVRDGEWVDGVVVHANGGVGFQSVAWRQEHFYDGQRAVLAMVLHKSACHPVHRGHHCDYRAALQSIHEMVRAQLKVRPPARGASQNGADVGLDELANKAAWCLEHGATNENADLARSVIAYRRALTSRSPVEK